MKKKLIEEYQEIENKLIPIKDFLLEKKDEKIYNKIFKGFITENGPILNSPDILFIGINPGAGAYISENNNSKENRNIHPVKLTVDENRELFLFERNNAYGGKYDGKWQSFEWYQKDKRINNVFTKRMIDLLDNIALKLYPKEHVKFPWNNNELPFWYKNFEKKLMYINLYPIATTNTSDLNKLFNLLCNEPEILKHFGQTKITNWQLRLHFINIVDEFVKLISPIVIVCLGTQAFNDFNYTQEKRKKTLFAEKHNIPVVGFSRKGNWSILIPKLSDLIINTLKKPLAI
jgi:hypothetical protein